MNNRQNPPYLAPTFFYHSFSPMLKRWFWVTFGLILCVLVGLIGKYYFPYFSSISLNILPETYLRSLPIWSEYHNYLEIEVVLDTYRQWGTYLGGILSADKAFLWIYVAGQLIGWSMILAFATRIRSRWSFAFFIAVLFFLFLSDLSEFLNPASTFPLVESGLAAVLLILAYLVQINKIKLPTYIVFLIFLLILSTVWGYLYLSYGWTAWLHTSSSQFFYILLISLALIWFSAKDLVNILLLATNNRRKAQDRWKISWLRVAIGIIIIYLLYLAWVYHAAIDITPTIRPIHFFVLAMLFMVITSQNLLRPVKFIFTSHTNFSFLLLAWILIVSSFLFFHSSSGDLTFLRALEKVISIFFLVVTTLYFFYLEFSFAQMLKRRVNIFYLVGSGTRLPFPAVMIAGLLAVLIYETTESWKSYRMFTQSYFLLEGDKAYHSGNLSQALNAYDLAVQWIPASPKGNYNKGVLLMDDPDAYQNALSSYTKVSEFYGNPYAALNSSYVHLQRKDLPSAKNVLLAQLDHSSFHKSYLSHNLSNIYLSQMLPDSAIFYLKKSLLPNPESSLGYTHLAGIYQLYDKPELSSNFVQASLETKRPESIALTNALSYDVEGVIDIGDSDLLDATKRTGDQAIVQNYLYFLMHTNQKRKALEQAVYLADSLGSPTGSMIAGYLEILNDSLEYGISRLNYVNLTYPSYKDESNFLLAMAYWKAGVWEMARHYFELSGENGNPQGYLNAARMEVLLGKQNTAATQLAQLRGEYPSLTQEVAKELSLLLRAYGQEIYAQTEWDRSLLNFNEKMRISIYADTVGEYLWALENYREMLTRDSTVLAPYKEMGKLYLKYNDTLARSTFKFGWKKSPRDPELLLGLSQSFLQMGKLDSAKFYLDQIEDTSKIYPGYLAVRADWNLQMGDTLAAIQLYNVALQKMPLNTKLTLTLSDLYLQRGQIDEAREVLAEALKFNDQNPYLWLYYAKVYDQWGMEKDSEYALERVRDLDPSILPAF